jgi:hypothetical protein
VLACVPRPSFTNTKAAISLLISPTQPEPAPSVRVCACARMVVGESARLCCCCVPAAQIRKRPAEASRWSLVAPSLNTISCALSHKSRPLSIAVAAPQRQRAFPP